MNFQSINGFFISLFISDLVIFIFYIHSWIPDNRILCMQSNLASTIPSSTIMTENFKCKFKNSLSNQNLFFKSLRWNWIFLLFSPSSVFKIPLRVTLSKLCTYTCLKDILNSFFKSCLWLIYSLPILSCIYLVDVVFYSSFKVLTLFLSLTSFFAWLLCLFWTSG